MSGSNRDNIIALGPATVLAVIVGLGLYLNASALQRGYERSAGKSAKDYAQKAASDLKVCAVMAPQNRFSCQQEANERAREGQRQEYDLEAQRITATWTAHMGMAAMIGMCVSIIGVGLIWTTFRETRRAANASANANSLLVAAQRAWIDIEPLIEIRPAQQERIFLRTEARFTNVGKSIARNVHFMSRLYATSFSEVGALNNDLFRQSRKNKGVLTLMPGKSRTGGQSTSGFSKEQVKWDDEGRAVFCIATFAIYMIEGDERLHYSRAKWYLRVAGCDFSNGAVGLTWKEFTDFPLEVDPQSYLDCT